MKASKFTDAQKAFIIKQGEEGTPVAEICRKAGISQATHFNWKKKYAGMLPTDMKKLRELEDENRRLKKIVADLSLDKEMLQDVIKRLVGQRKTEALPWRKTVGWQSKGRKTPVCIGQALRVNRWEKSRSLRDWAVWCTIQFAYPAKGGSP